MSVMLSAASCLDWACQLTGVDNVPALIAEVEKAPLATTPVWFLPYLSGERTPHNNPNAKGAFWGFTHQHGRADLARAVLEGVGFALADGMDAVHASGLQPTSVTLIGGGLAVPIGGKCWLISVAKRWNIVPEVMSAQRWVQPGWLKLH